MKNRLYLFILEVTPVQVGGVYNPLPSHLTLMSRFLSNMRPEAISKVVRPLFESTKPIVLAFGETVELGPKRLLVHMVNQPKESELHNQLREVLDAVNVEYQYPQFIGDNHKAHVTYREGVRFSAGDTHISPAVYLVEVVEGDRVIRARYPLNG